MGKGDFLQHNKAFRPIIGKGVPKDSEGIDGDFSLRSSNEGLKLYVKFGGVWYFVSQLVATGRLNVPLAREGSPARRNVGSGSNLSVESGQRFFLDSRENRRLANTGDARQGRTFFRYTPSSKPIGGIAKRHVALEVAGRPIMYCIEDGASSQLFLPNNTSYLNTGRIYLESVPDVTLGNTYINAAGPDELTIVVGGQSMLHFDEDTTNTMESQEIAEYLIRSSTTEDPILHLKNETNDTTGPTLKLTNVRASNGSVLGNILFSGKNDADSDRNYAQITGSIEDVADGSEKGQLHLSVTTVSATAGGIDSRHGLILTGSSTIEEVDVTIGNGSQSLTTISGDLDIDGNKITVAGALEIDAGGDVNITGQDFSISSGKNFYLDGNTGIGGSADTYIREHSDDAIRWYVGGQLLMNLIESGADGNLISFDASIAMQRYEATFSATGVIGSGGTDDTDIDFRHSNKYRLEMTGDITTVNLIMPGNSANCVLVCTTNGDHDVTNWKVYDSTESAATTTDVMWPGGSVPAFTNNGIDIVSFYWDASEKQCYGVASLAFATP